MDYYFVKQKNKHLSKATDEFINSIIESLNKYTIDLAKAQIRIAFEQSEKEIIEWIKA